MILDERIGREMVTSFMNDLHDAQEITSSGFASGHGSNGPSEFAAKFLTRLL